MKIIHFLGCMLIGHNKVLEHWIEGGYTVYFTVCTQCSKKWRMKELSEKPKVVIKTNTIRMLAQGKIITIQEAPKIIVSQKIRKKQLVNIYLI